MKHIAAKSLFTLSLFLPQLACADKIERIYLDAGHNVHAVFEDGKDLRLSSTGDSIQPLLSADKSTVGWLRSLKDFPDASNDLTVYRDGRQYSLSCEPFIRDFWFLSHGTQVGIDCGGLHFAGREMLYGIPSMKKLASFSQALVPMDERPAWSKLSPGFVGDGD
jgi:hypothetical protein